MLKNHTNFFEYKDSFKKHKNSRSVLIKGQKLKNLPLVSFVIPTYKCNPDVLKEAIDSALNQYDFDDYEVLIIDNNPDFNCPTHQLINSYSDEKIIYYKNCENLGMFGNWNRGVELSRSNWIAYLHDDDITSPYFLNACFSFLNDKLLDKNKSIGIIKPFNVKFSDSKELNFRKPLCLKLERLSLIDFIWGCEIGAPTNIIYNRSVLFELGGFNPDYFPTADYSVAINCVNEYKVYRIPFVLGGYRVGQNESLNPLTMKMYFMNRFFITSFVMSLFYFPYFLISGIQSSLMPKVILNTNNFYNVNIYFDYCKELNLRKRSAFIQLLANKFLMLFRMALVINRKYIKK